MLPKTEHVLWKWKYCFFCFYCSPENAPLQEFLESCLRHKSELVIYEAARALVNLKNVKTKDLQPAVSGTFIVFVLCRFLLTLSLKIATKGAHNFSLCKIETSVLLFEWKNMYKKYTVGIY